MNGQRVAIIGSGIGGLGLANLLAKQGATVTVYEKNEQLGGRAGKKQENGFTFDTGPSWYLMPDVFERYFAQFGRSAQNELDLIRLDPGYKVFFDHHEPVTIHGNLQTDSATFESIEPGAGQALRQYVRDGNEIYRLALEHFLYTDFHDLKDMLRPTILKRLTTIGRLLMQPLHQRVKGVVKSQPLQQILEYPMVFLGTSPFEAPAMYSLMSALDFDEGVYYPKRGMYSIIELLIDIGQSLGVVYKTNTGVTRIKTQQGSVTAIELSDGTSVDYDLVISNGDLHHTETKLLEPSAQSYPEHTWQKRLSGISGLLLYLGVKGELPQLEHHNLYFVDRWHENFEAIYKTKTIPEHASLYVSRTTATDPSTAPAGHENLFMLVPLPTGVSVDSAKAGELAANYLQQFARVINQPDLPDRIVSRSIMTPDDFGDRFYAWENTALGMSHVLGQSALWRIPPQSKKLSNLYYVGASTMPGIGLPMCLISAEVVYNRIMEHRS